MLTLLFHVGLDELLQRSCDLLPGEKTERLEKGENSNKGATLKAITLE